MSLKKQLTIYMILYSCSVVLCENLGKWGDTLTFKLVPAAAAISPSTNELILWAAFKPEIFQQRAAGQTITSKLNLENQKISDIITVSNTAHDMFCPGISITFDGKIIVTGGDTAAKTSIYNGAWEPGEDMNIPRGYQGSTTLSDGKVFILGGSWSGNETTEKVGELWDPKTNKWTLLTGCHTKPMLTNDKETAKRDCHPWLFAWTNGFVFQAGPSKQMNWYSSAGTGTSTPAGTRADDGDAMSGNAVMYDAVAGKIFTAGGSPSYSDSPATSNAYIITIGKPNEKPSVKKIKSMSKQRAFANSVVLPDGKIFVVGGQTTAKTFSDDNAVLTPELWDPETETFTDMAAGPTPRNYHSVALLMPDATVFSSGGGLSGGNCNCDHFDGQFYSPPYLFGTDGKTPTKRPAIQTVPKEAKVGGSFDVSMEATGKGNLTFSLIPAGSATHTINTDQRRVPLKTTSTTSPFKITLPSDPGMLLPGYWMLFALDNGVPSVGKFIKITLEGISNRNSIARENDVSEYYEEC